jgi:YHS domain-containing protein
MAIDPVCGKDIHPKMSQWLVEYHGSAYHFCTSVCRDQFVENPAEFVSNRDKTSTNEQISERERVPVVKRAIVVPETVSAAL